MTPQQALDLAHDRPSSCDDDLYDWAVDAENALRLMAERLMVAEELAAQYGAKNDALLVTFAKVCARLGIDTEAAKTAPGKPSDVLVAAIDALAATPAQAQQAIPMSHLQAVMLWGNRSDGPTTPEIVSYARVIERACAEAWGVKLAGIGASTKEGGNV